MCAEIYAWKASGALLILTQQGVALCQWGRVLSTPKIAHVTTNRSCILLGTVGQARRAPLMLIEVCLYGSRTRYPDANISNWPEDEGLVLLVVCRGSVAV